ncbi:MAG: acyl-CoA dehydrogenase family protein [Dehalococcoidia bacterium]|nr:acyl-CoA dehydrogenase family protein [Dehalococcoidia bacterium]
MNFELTEEERVFRDELRRFFAANPPPRGEESAEYRRLLADHGWQTMHWPMEYGGQGASHFKQVVLKEEAFHHEVALGAAGPNLIGPTLIVHGSEEQRARHLPPIAAAEVVWCQGFSEPGAGSDLASLSTRAVRDGDEYVVNGQKIWTSNAHLAQWIFMLARTDPDAPKHRGISYLMVDMSSPGVTVRPLLQLTGHHGFNEVFFDDVRVPVANRVGEEDRGWYVATTTLDFERSGIERVLTADRDLGRLEDWWRESPSTFTSRPGAPSKRARVAELRVAVEVSRLLSYRVAWMQSRALVPNHEASMTKMYASDVGQWVAQLVVNAAGLAGNLRPEEPRAPQGGAPAMRYMDSVRLTIGQGTGEIQRNVIATRGLGLPRG